MNRGNDESAPVDADSAPADTGEPGSSTPSALDGLRERAVDLASAFLSPRGTLEGQSPLEAISALGQRADSLVRSFVKGLASPTEGDGASTDPGRTNQSATELVGLVLSRASQAVSQGFHSYLATHAEKAEDGEVVVDGRFVWKHGAPLISSVVDALGKQMSRSLDPSQDSETPPPRVDYRLDLGSIFGSLLQRPSPENAAHEVPEGSTSGHRDEETPETHVMDASTDDAV